MEKKAKQVKHADLVIALVNEILDLFDDDDIDRGAVGCQIEAIIRKGLANGL